MSKKLVSAIDIRPDKIICLVAQELEIVNQGKILQLIGSGISKFSINCVDPFSLDKSTLIEHLKEVIKKSEDEASIKIKDVYINISESVTPPLPQNIGTYSILLGLSSFKSLFQE